MDRVEFLHFRRAYERALRQVLLDFEFFVEDFIGINIYSVTHRLKSFESALEKSKRLKIQIDEMHDIAGMRIVVSTLDEVEVVARFFSRKEVSKDLIIKSDKNISRKNGYRARHLILEFTGHYSRSIYPAFVEVQILTLLQSTFNYISRSWVYKTDRALTEEWHTNFKDISRTLAEIDERFAWLQGKVIESSVSTASNDSLTPFSYQKIVSDIFGETIQINDAVDETKMLIDIGYDTNGKIKRFFEREDILSMYEQIILMNSESEKVLKSLVTDMSIKDFYMFFGLRYSSVEEIMQVKGDKSGT
ncbi:MAG: hypothetical protein AAF773_13670 [Cyanobacteria bacterium P01_D01_bin.115]